jgi:reductive dehalogenase
MGISAVFNEIRFAHGEIQSAVRPAGGGSKDRVEIDPMLMSKKIKALGIHLGAQKVRITELNQDWVYTYYAHPYTSEPYGKPVDLNYKYIICSAVWQDPFMMASGTGIAANFEVGWKYAYASFLSVILAQFIRAMGWKTRALPPSNSPYLVPPVFVDAGIGEFGRCGFVVTKEFGNNFRPGAVATNMPLAVDKPVDFGLQDFCTKCKICADMCPSGAIPKGEKVTVRGVRRWDIDGEKCRGYWDSIGGSCGICQVVCPFNHRNNLFHNTMREVAERIPSLRDLLIYGEKLFYGNDLKKALQPGWINLK